MYDLSIYLSKRNTTLSIYLSKRIQHTTTKMKRKNNYKETRQLPK